MNSLKVNPQNIIDRLKFYNYRHKLNGTVLTVYLSMLCYLEINFTTDKVKISSHLIRGGFVSRIEYVFLLYIIFFLGFTYLNQELMLKIFYPLVLFLLYLIICFIKTENMKAIIYNWLENDFQ